MNLKQERQHLAHPSPVQFHNQPTILFVTVCVQPRGSHLDNADVHAAFRRAALDADAWRIGRYVIMPDHFHFLCAPAADPVVSVRRWISFLKRRITFHLGEHLWKWQNDAWDTQMRSQTQCEEKWNYVRMNPVRDALAPDPESWPYCGELNVLEW